MILNYDVEPNAGCVVVEVMTVENKTEAGIYMPEKQAKVTHKQGKVIAVGRPKIFDTGTEIPLYYRVGDVVIYRASGSVELSVKGVKVAVLESFEILGKLIKEI